VGAGAAALTRHFGDLDIAEEAAAEAFATAVERWPAGGVPPPRRLARSRRWGDGEAEQAALAAALGLGDLPDRGDLPARSGTQDAPRIAFGDQRIHVRYSGVTVPADKREAADRALATHQQACPVACSIEAAIDITTNWAAPG
jgi:hypothetical protein